MCSRYEAQFRVLQNQTSEWPKIGSRLSNPESVDRNDKILLEDFEGIWNKSGVNAKNSTENIIEFRDFFNK